MAKTVITFDLSKPEEARSYLKQFRFKGGHQPTFVTFENGDQVYFDSMTDEQATAIASQFWEMELMARGYQ